MNRPLFFPMGLLLAVMALGCAQPTPSPSAETMRVMSFNIRYNNPDDGENAWPNRKEQVAGLIRFHGADLIGVQEALRGQLDDLSQWLPEYAWIGVGRDDGAAAGEFSPILFRWERFEVLENETFWLSETPDTIGSRGWDAALPRIATWAKFRDRQTGAIFFLFNTHFDHRGEVARTESARLLRARIAAATTTAPVLLTGDFNFTPDAEGYHLLTDSSHTPILLDTHLHAPDGPYGPARTFSGFYVNGIEEDNRIDYIFVTPQVEIRRYGILTDSQSGRYPSDHLPVLAEVVLTP